MRCAPSVVLTCEVDGCDFYKPPEIFTRTALMALAPQNPVVAASIGNLSTPSHEQRAGAALHCLLVSNSPSMSYVPKSIG